MGEISANSSCDVSVIIVNWNLKDFLLEAVDSVYQTITERTFEVIVVDNASTDGSAKALRERFPDVKLIKLEKNVGFGAGNNRGIELASGRYFLLLNNDAQLQKGAVEALVEYMDENEDAGICGGQLINSDGSLQNSFDNVPNLATELLNKSLLRRLNPSRYPSKLQEVGEPREVEVVIGAMMMVHAETVHQLGGFDEDYFMFFEETDLCHRFSKAGRRVVQIPSARAIHHQGASSVRRNPGPSRIEYARSRNCFFRKWSSPPACWVLGTGIFLKVIVNLILNLIAGILSLFLHRKVRERIKIYSTLLLWHLLLCPDSMGLRPKEN